MQFIEMALKTCTDFYSTKKLIYKTCSNASKCTLYIVAKISSLYKLDTRVKKWIKFFFFSLVQYYINKT